jgi:hypothetical protein
MTSQADNRTSLQKSIDDQIAALVVLRKHDAALPLASHAENPALHFERLADFAKKAGAISDPVLLTVAYEAGFVGHDLDRDIRAHSHLASDSDALCDFIYELEQRAERRRDQRAA